MQSNESKDPVEEVPEMDRLENELAILNANIKDLQEKARECRDALKRLQKIGLH